MAMEPSAPTPAASSAPKTAAVAAKPATAASKPAAKTVAKPAAKPAVKKPVAAPKKKEGDHDKKHKKSAKKHDHDKKDDKKSNKKNDANKDKSPKIKMKRDSFTMPKEEYAQIDLMKARLLSLGQPAKKSELLRAGVQLLAAMSDSTLKATMAKIPVIKTGRPKK